MPAIVSENTSHRRSSEDAMNTSVHIEEEDHVFVELEGDCEDDWM